eukprot:TRINITY_DN2586_c0_g1_i2.p1 TRINITY_DN2586_c0_g1~~TRINITY_DN2586_c0_g1_i2.p1  ORF type:complete len:1629 (-),score=406.81 TRINITY_DN2586_c0_g1_i2:223-5109(-)
MSSASGLSSSHWDSSYSEGPVAEFFCGGGSWGPWQDYAFTFCFDGFVVSLMRIIMLPLLIGRFVQAYRHEHCPPRGRSIKFRIQVICCWIMSFLFIINIGGSLIAAYPEQPAPYLLFENTLGVFLFVLAVFVQLEERRRYMPHNFVLIAWWILELFVSTLQLPTVVETARSDVDSETLWSDLIFVFMLVNQFALCFLLLFAQQASYHKPPREPSSRVGSPAYGSISPSSSPSLEQAYSDRAQSPQPDSSASASEGEEEATEDRPLLQHQEDVAVPIPSSGKAPDDVNIFSFLTYSFITKLLNLTGDFKRRSGMTVDDIQDLARQDMSEPLSARYATAWQKELVREQQLHKPPKAARALISLFWQPLAIAGLIRALYIIAEFVPPVSLYWMIYYATPLDPKTNKGHQSFAIDQWKGFLVAVIVLVSGVIASLCQHVYLYMSYRLGQNVRSCIVTAVYRKCFKLSHLALYKFPAGIIVTHMSVDPMAILELVPNIHMLWSAPVEIILSLVLLLVFIGPSSLVGVATILASIPVNAICMKKTQKFKQEMMKHKDTRGKLLNEVLQAMKTVKLMVWEGHLHGQLNEARHNEVAALLRVILWRSGMQFITWCLPMLVSLLTFSVYIVATNSDLTTLAAFSSIAMFNVIRFPMMRLPKLLTDLLQSSISLKRITTFLTAPELDITNVQEFTNQQPPPDTPAIKMDQATFIWEDNEKVALSGIDFHAHKGQLVAVIGQVASGKSALLQALMGFMKRVSGEVQIYGSIAYAAQHAWVQNLSFRDNILFGKQFDSEWYDRVVRACELERDISIIKGGDVAEIGEEGNNLSGGQKQRLALARAVYQDSNIYLLDDTLSAVDANVGESIFKNCFCGLLKDKTRVFVTQQFQYLNRVDYIFVMREGVIVEAGTYAQLNASKDSEFAHLNSNYEQAMSHSEEPAAGAAKPAPPKPKPVHEAPTEIIAVEERSTGSVPLSTYILYLIEAGVAMMLITLFLFIVSTFGNLFCNFWLSLWTQSQIAEDYSHSTGYWLGIYAGIILTTCFFLLIRFFSLATANMRASERLHSKALIHVLESSMNFFQSTPVGRILNRFSEDMFTIDDKINFSLSMFLGTFMLVIGTVCIVSYTCPFFLAAVFPLLYLYTHTQEWYLVYARELVRLDAISRSPLYASFSETIRGLTTIRCMKQVDRFIAEVNHKLDMQQKAFYALCVANRWLGVRVDFVATGAMFVTFLLCAAERGNINSNLIALSLIFCLQYNNLLTLLVQSTTEVAGQMVSVQRISSYLDLPPELGLKDSEPGVIVPPKDWPQHGKVEFADYSLCYRPGLPNALNNLTFTANPGEKIGVVGRTGAGKSSLMVALFRLSEAAGGKILVDDVDISKVSLQTLRSRLCVIPQDPVLFRGTLRKNLDVLDKYQDPQLWDALESVNLKAQVEAKPEGLNCEVTEGGENWSIGERQLICLARGLLSRAPIIILDEATANIDLATEQQIHKAIFTQSTKSTMFLIAHRTHTILTCDRVAMMEKGELVCYGPPEELMETNAMFSGLIKKSGFKSHGFGRPDLESKHKEEPHDSGATTSAAAAVDAATAEVTAAPAAPEPAPTQPYVGDPSRLSVMLEPAPLPPTQQEGAGQAGQAPTTNSIN